MRNGELEPEDIAFEEKRNQEKTVVLKSLRVAINATIAEAKQAADAMGWRDDGGPELSLCITNLQQARQWAGEALGEIGHKLPEEYRDAAKPRQPASDPMVISAEMAMQRYGTDEIQKLLSDGFLEPCDGYILKPAIPTNE